jgi:hypothetical protein
MHSVAVVLYGATVTIDDQQDPSFTAQHTVAAANGSWHTANSTAVTLPAASDNTGIRERRAIVDGIVQQTWAAPGAIASGCGELNSGVAYTFTQPCAGARGLNSAMPAVLSLAGLEDGVRTVRFSAVDTGGREVLSPEYTIKLDRNPPALAAASPGQLSAGQPLTFATAVSDGASGVATTEREMSVDGGGWEPMSGVAQAGRAYRFRVRAVDVAGNRSAWVETTSVRVPAAPMPEPSPSPTGPNAGADAAEPVPLLPAADAPAAAAPPTASVAIPAPQVAPTTTRADGTPRVRAARLDRTRLRVSGTLPITASGRLTVTFAGRVRGRTVKVSQRVGVSRGRWSASLPIKGALRTVTAGTLTVRYAGDGAVAPGTTARVIKRR